MGDTITTTTRRTYIQRLGDSFVGVAIGLVLLLAAPVLLIWNEGRAVAASQGLGAAARTAVAVADAQPRAANEGKLVFVTGAATAPGPLADPDLAVSAPGALVLVRTVEMFQWVESSTTQTTEKVGGTAETTRTTSYEKAWRADAVDSSRFAQPDGHANPAMPLSSRTVTAPDARLGGYSLGADLLALLPTTTPFVPADLPEGWREAPGGAYRGTGTPAAPAIGDLRVTWTIAPAGPLSVMGAQQAGSLVSWTAPNRGYQVLLATPGISTVAAMVAGARDAENVLSWVLRGLGAVLCMAAIGLIAGPLRALANVLPFAASVIGSVTGFGAMLIGGALALVVIALAWFLVRPVLSLVLIGLAVASLIAVSRLAPARPGHTGDRPGGFAATGASD